MQEVGWRAELQLSFALAAERTQLQERRHVGPLRVQRPFYPEGPRVCHVYLLHPPGGVVGGDQLHVTARVLPGAHALLTTPAATKLYRSHPSRSLASQQHCFHVDSGGTLEWLPQETIAFAGARAQLDTRVQLARTARFIGWEILCLGRPAAGELFDRGEVAPSFELVRDSQLHYLERGRYAGDAPIMHAPWGLAGQPVVGTMLCAAPSIAQHVELARAVVHAHTAALDSPDRAAVSGWDDRLLARYLGPSTERARNLFAALWSALRPVALGCPASAPRIWRT